MNDRPKTALIVGESGQDGTLLRQSLETRGNRVIGISRRGVVSNDTTIFPLKDGTDISDYSSILHLLEHTSPDEVYYLAAYHGSSETMHSDTDPHEYDNYAQVHVNGLLNFLSAICKLDSGSRLFYAASSLVFDGSNGPTQNENTPFSPVGFYGLTKVQGILLCREFRQKHRVFASTGILYNHESVLRKNKFLSKKLILAAHRISQGLDSELVLGNLDAEADWGYAPDFVEAFQQVLQANHPDDFVIATGESHTVREFASLVFDRFSLDANDYIRQDKTLIDRKPIRKIGDYSHLANTTGWSPSRSFSDMVTALVNDYLDTVKTAVPTTDDDKS